MIELLLLTKKQVNGGALQQGQARGKERNKIKKTHEYKQIFGSPSDVFIVERRAKVGQPAARERSAEDTRDHPPQTVLRERMTDRRS